MKKTAPIAIITIAALMFVGCSDVAIEPELDTPEETTPVEETVTLALLDCKDQKDANQELADFDVMYVGHECSLSDGTTLYGMATNDEGQVVAHYQEDTLLNSAVVDPCRSMGDVSSPRIADFDNGIVTVECKGGDAGHFTGQTHELDLETFEITLLEDVSGAYYNDENISFKYYDPSVINLDTRDTVILGEEDGGFIEFYTGEAEKVVAFDPEEDFGPTDSNFVDLTVKKGTVKNSNEVNEFLFEDGGYSVENAIGLIFFYVENDEEEIVQIHIEYTGEEQKAYFLEVIESLEVL